MAELNLFHYLPQDSPIHRMDPRLKVAGVASLSVTVGFAQSTADFLLVSLFLLLAAFFSRLPLGVFLRELHRFSILIFATILLQAWGHPENQLLLGIPGLSQEGLFNGLIFAWRLIMVLVVGLLMTGTTQLTDIRAAIYWFLRPLPWIPAARIATMFSITLNLIPLIFDQAASIQEAQVSRGIEQVKNPLKRLFCLSWPILRETFNRADELALAMESRCYSETRTQPQFFRSSLDLWMFYLVLTLMLVTIWLG